MGKTFRLFYFFASIRFSLDVRVSSALIRFGSIAFVCLKSNGNNEILCKYCCENTTIVMSHHTEPDVCVHLCTTSSAPSVCVCVRLRACLLLFCYLAATNNFGAVNENEIVTDLMGWISIHAFRITIHSSHAEFSSFHLSQYLVHLVCEFDNSNDDALTERVNLCSKCQKTRKQQQKCIQLIRAHRIFTSI